MSNTKQTITDSEYEIMRILWRTDKKMTVADVVRELDKNVWTPSTVSTFLQRLLKKGVISCEKKRKTVKINIRYHGSRNNNYNDFFGCCNGTC